MTEAHCKGCGLPMTEGRAYELGTHRWHTECFKCVKCNSQLTARSSMLVLGDGSPVCKNCSYVCVSCNKRITDMAVLTNDLSFCMQCFVCRNCKKRIDDLQYARTSQGFFCMTCHNALLQRKKQRQKLKEQQKQQSVEELTPSERRVSSSTLSSIDRNKPMPGVPPPLVEEKKPHKVQRKQLAPSAFQNDKEEPEELELELPSKSQLRLSPSSPASSIASSTGTARTSHLQLQSPLTQHPAPSPTPKSPFGRWWHKSPTTSVNFEEEQGAASSSMGASSSLGAASSSMGAASIGATDKAGSGATSSVALELEREKLRSELLEQKVNELMRPQSELDELNFELSKLKEEVKRVKEEYQMWATRAAQQKLAFEQTPEASQTPISQAQFMPLKRLFRRPNNKEKQTQPQQQSSSQSYQSNQYTTDLSNDTGNIYARPTTVPPSKPDTNSSILGESLSFRVNMDQTDVPLFVSKCFNEIEKRALDTEGLYRKPGSNSQIEAILEQFGPHGDVQHGEELLKGEIQAVTSAVKKYLRYLSEPVITYDCYDAFIAAGNSKNVGYLKKCIQSLPKENYNTLKAVVNHLVKVAEHKESNLMNVANLATVFAPTLSREESGQREVQDMQARNEAMQMLILEREVVFA